LVVMLRGVEMRSTRADAGLISSMGSTRGLHVLATVWW
jgi:hypothetical protein